jgi:hypothetical protein
MRRDFHAISPSDNAESSNDTLSSFSGSSGVESIVGSTAGKLRNVNNTSVTLTH